MIICEHTISEYTLNGKALYNVTIVYKISNRSSELLAQLTVDPNENKTSIVSIGTEWTDSKAEAERIQKLMKMAGRSVKLFMMEETLAAENFKRRFPDLDMPKPCSYRHTDYRK